MTGGEEMDQFEADLWTRVAEVRAGPNGGYPEGYRDPEYDGTAEGFCNVVIPARAAAIPRTLNEAFADLLPEDCRFEWATEGQE